MPDSTDNIEIHTVIPYPKKKIKNDSTMVEIEGKRKTLEGTPLHHPSYDSILLGSTLTSLLFILLMRFFYRNTVNGIFLYNYSSLKKSLESKLQFELLSTLKHLLSFTTLIGLAYYLLINNSQLKSWQALTYTSISLFAIVLVRTLLILTSGYFINNTRLSICHLNILSFFNKIIGLSLFPFLVLGLLLPNKGYIIVLSATIFIFTIKIIGQLFFVYKVLRGRKFSIFHSFLYLCTLEVLPIVYIVVIVGYLRNYN